MDSVSKLVIYTLLIMAVYIISAKGIVSLWLAIVALAVTYHLVFSVGVSFFNRLISTRRPLPIKPFIFSQCLMFVGLFVTIGLTGLTSDVNPVLETIHYFEMGSFALLITTVIFYYREAREPRKRIRGYRQERRVGFLTIFSAMIFFITGVFLVITEAFGVSNKLIYIGQNAAAILGTINLLAATIELMLFYYRMGSV